MRCMPTQRTYRPTHHEPAREIAQRVASEIARDRRPQPDVLARVLADCPTRRSTRKTRPSARKSSPLRTRAASQVTGAAAPD